MVRKSVCRIFFSLLLTSMLSLIFNINPVKASGTICIRADGSIDPATAPIYSADNITYFLTDNITVDYGYDGIVVEKSHIVIDGNRCMLQGDWGYGMGICMSGLSNVTVQNISITGFECGICLNSSASVTISSSNVTIGYTAISLINSSRNAVSENRIYGRPCISLESSSNNSIYGNTLDGSETCAKIWVHQSSDNNEIHHNTVVIGDVAIFVEGSNNRVWSNRIACEEGVYIIGSNNTVFGNKLGGAYLGGFNNTIQGNEDVWFIVVIKGANNTFSRNRCLLRYYVSIEGFNHIVTGNEIEAEMYGLSLSSASNCTISGNRIRRVSGSGISIDSSSNNVISGNDITDNNIGIVINSGATHNSILHNNFTANMQQASVTASGTQNVWDDGYPSGGNYWSDHNTPDLYGGYHQDELGSDGIVDTPYIMDANNTDNYPLMQPYKGHNIAVTNAQIYRNIAAQGTIQKIDIEVANIGSFPQSFNLTVYANNTEAQTLAVFLAIEESKTFRFYWDTSVLPYGNYTIAAYAWPVRDETNTIDNALIGGTVYVGIPGDVLPERGQVDMKDVGTVVMAFGSVPGYLNWNPIADVNCDEQVDMKDVGIAVQHFGETSP